MKRKRDVSSVDDGSQKIMKLRARPVRDNDIISKFRSDIQVIFEKPINLDRTKVVDLWEWFYQAQYTISNHPEFDVLFSKLYTCTSRGVLLGHLSSNLQQDLKLRFRVVLKKLAQSLHTTNQEFSSYCKQLASVLEHDNPWNPDYIVVFQYKLIATEDEANILWQKENEILIRLRIECLIIICSQEEKKGIPFKWNPLSFAHTAYLINNNNKKNGGQKSKYHSFINIYYLLLCRHLLQVKNITLMNLLNIQEAVNVIKNLESVGFNEQIHSKWGKWKSASKTIINQVVNSIFQMNVVGRRLGSRVVKCAFSYWIKYICNVNDHTDGCLSGVKNLVLSNISNVDTDYFYDLADVIWDDYLKLQLTPVLRDNTFIFISVMAMNTDYNKISTQDDSRFDAIEEGHLNNYSNEIKLTYKKLSKRYLDLANRFLDDKEIYFHLCLTAFSLDRSPTLYNHLFKERDLRSSKEKSKCIKETENSIHLDSESVLNIDLWSAITNPRLSNLKLLEQNVDRKKVQELCDQIVKTGGPRVKTKSDLHDLYIDFNTYTPPQCNLENDEEDSGFEKGYEPQVLPLHEQNHKSESTKKNRKRKKSSDENDNNLYDSTTKAPTMNKRFFSKDEVQTLGFQPTIPIKRLKITNSAESSSSGENPTLVKIKEHAAQLPIDSKFFFVSTTKVSSGVLDLLGISINDQPPVLLEGEELLDKRLAIITTNIAKKLSSSLKQIQSPSSLESSSSSSLPSKLSSKEQKKVGKSYNLRKKKSQKQHLPRDEKIKNDNRQPLKEFKNIHNINQNQQSATHESLGKRKRQSLRIRIQ